MYSCQFSKNFPLPKNGGHFEFSNFYQKCLKHKFACISLTVRDRAILSKFSTHRVSEGICLYLLNRGSSKFLTCRVSEECTLANFQKNFPLPKNGGHFEFSNFCQKCLKHKFACISLTVRDRAILSKLPWVVKIFDPQGI